MAEVRLGVDEVHALSKKHEAVKFSVPSGAPNAAEAEAATPTRVTIDLIVEKPLEISVNGTPHAVTMHTPGSADDDLSLAAGFCFTDGVYDDFASDVVAVEFDAAESRAFLTLNPPALERFRATIAQRTALGALSSCALCGKRSLAEIARARSASAAARADGDYRVTSSALQDLARKLEAQQSLYAPTRAAHACALFDAAGALVSFAEDVGRHNALDKAIGHALRAHRLCDVRAAALSSRCSFEMMHKCVRAGIAVVVGLSAATSQAVALAEQYNVTAASVSLRTSPVTITAYTHASRIVP